MIRSFLDITSGISRSTHRVNLIPTNLNDPTYYIFGTTEWGLNDVLPEMEIGLKNKISITVNGQFVPNDYYVLQTESLGITVKFIKSAMAFGLDSQDDVILKGDIRRYA